MDIIILPGLDGTGLLLAQFQDRLGKKHSVSVLRYPPDLYRYDDLHRWIEKKMPGGDVVIVAESFSGPLGIRLATQKPPGLKGIVFVATFARSPVRLPRFLAHLTRIMPVKSTFFTWLIQPLVMGRWSNAAFTRKFRHALQAVPAATLAGRLGEVLAVDNRKQLRGLSIPVLYLQAMQDRLVPRSAAEDFDLGPGTILPVEGPHFILQANAKQSADIILEFVDRLP